MTTDVVYLRKVYSTNSSRADAVSRALVMATAVILILELGIFVIIRVEVIVGFFSVLASNPTTLDLGLDEILDWIKSIYATVNLGLDCVILVTILVGERVEAETIEEVLCVLV